MSNQPSMLERLTLAAAEAVKTTPASWTQEKWDDDTNEEGPRQSLGEFLEFTHLGGIADEIIADAARIAVNAILTELEAPTEAMIEAGMDYRPIDAHSRARDCWKAMIRTAREGQ